MKKLILASSSPRRIELMKLIADDFSVIPSNVNEDYPEILSKDGISEFLACKKARDVFEKNTDALVIGADTTVLINNEILGKPKNINEARIMIKKLSGNTHKVITGCALFSKETTISFSSITEVEFYTLTDETIEEYINTNEPYDKAGGYGIQGKAGLFVKKINGDYNNVVGFPVAELNRILVKNFK